MAGAIKGDGKGTCEEKEGGRAIGIHPTRGPLQLFSRGCAYVSLSVADSISRPKLGSDRTEVSDRIGSKIGSVSMPALYVILNSICMPRLRRRSVEGRNIGPGLGFGLDSSVPVSISVPEKCLDSGYLVLALSIIGTLSVSNRQSCIE